MTTPRHFLSLRDHATDTLTALFNRADTLAGLWRAGRMRRALTGRRVGLWFYGNGFRNRVAFELGAQAMGAITSFIPGDLGVQEPLEDMPGYLDNWFSLLVIRARRHADLVALAQASRIPVINARTDLGHPCEVMGDLLTMRQVRGKLDGLRVVFVGEMSNLGRSWLEAANRLPIQVTQVCPPGYEASADLLADLRRDARGGIAVSHDLDAALEGADLLYTDCWPAALSPHEKTIIGQAFLPYQIRPDHLARMAADGVFLPCPPVTRGEEVSAAAMQSPRCQNHAAKDNLLHIQNAIMEWALEG